MSPVLHALSTLAGIFVVLATAGSLIRTTVLPRALASRLSVFIGRRLVYKGILKLSHRFDNYEAKDRILSYGAPLALLSLIAAWMLSFFFGYTLILWGIEDTGFLTAAREIGSSLFTLGFSGRDLVWPTIVYFFAAFTGLIVVALQIAYLPVLYQAFNRREALVTLLQSRAGAPAWGPEILARAQMVDLVEELRSIYSDWERWTAEVMESHTTYTVLLWFRSPHPLRSWVIALLAVMDSAALYAAFAPSRVPAEARLCLRMGFTCLRNIAEVLNIPYDPDPFPDDPIELSYEEFMGGVARLQELGFPMERTPEEAWPHFRGWRVNYESIAYELADRVVAPPGPWSGTRAHLPGMNFIPQRPANRSPDDHQRDRPKAERHGWHA